MAHSVVCLSLSHLATGGGRHYASLSVCLRRHLLSLGQFFALAALRSVPHRKRHLRQAGSQFLRARCPSVFAKASTRQAVQNFMEFYSEGQANSISGVMEIDDFGLKINEVSVFSFPRCRFASDGIFDRFQDRKRLQRSGLRFSVCFS